VTQENGLEGAIPSKQFDVWTRLYKRYLLEPGPLLVTRAALGLTVLPVTQADRLLQRPDVRVFTVSITSQSTFTMATVPLGERWTLSFMEMVLAGGTWTHNRLDLRDPGGANMIIDNYTATGGSELFQPNTPVTLDELWEIRVNVNSHSGAGNGQLTVLIEVEDAF